LQAPIGLSFGPFSLLDDGWSPTKVGIGGCHIAQAFVVTLMIVMLDERVDLGFEVAGQEVVLQGLMPAFDLALCLRMERRAAHMATPTAAAL
jgi:hypothetical protein